MPRSAMQSERLYMHVVRVYVRNARYLNYCQSRAQRAEQKSVGTCKCCFAAASSSVASERNTHEDFNRAQS
jgi:hypothetical protein